MDNSPFRKLPPELRLEIFGYVLYSPSRTGVFEWDDKGPKVASWMTADSRQALTQVCREIREETFPILYGFDKLCFSPLILNKFHAGFFVTDDDYKHQMIREYLGPSDYWLQRLSSWLEHMGEGMTQHLKVIDIHVGLWKKEWLDLENPLILWLTEALASLVRFFEGFERELCLCFRLEVEQVATWHGDLQLRLPISNMAAAYDALVESITKGKDEIDSHLHRYPRLATICERLYDKHCDSLWTYLNHLEDRVKEQPSKQKFR